MIRDTQCPVRAAGSRPAAWLLALGLFLAAGSAWAIPVMDNGAGRYSDNFDSTQGISGSFQVDINTVAHQVNLSAGRTTGWLQSSNITPTSLQGWQWLDVSVAVPAGNTLNVDVLDLSQNLLMTVTPTGTTSTAFDLSGLSVTGIILRARFEAPAGQTPVLKSWGARWGVKPNVLFKLTAATDSDSTGGTVTAAHQITYTISYDINNVDAHNAVASVTLSAQDAYGVEMVNYAGGSAVPAPSRVVGRYYAWDLGSFGLLRAGTNGNITFTLNVPNGTTCSWNSAGHSGGRPIELTAKFQSVETGSAGVMSSPAGNSLVGTAGAPTVTRVSSSARDALALMYPRNAVPGMNYTYIYRASNLSHICPTPWSGDEIMRNVRLTNQIPAGTTYVGSGLYNSSLAGNTPIASSYDGGSGNVTWTLGKEEVHSCWACTYGQGVYLYVTVYLPPALAALTLNPATLISDQTNSRTAAGAAVALVTEAAVTANPGAFVQFSIASWNTTVQACDTIYPIRNIMSQVNKPFPGAYILQPVPDAATLHHWDRYCYPGSCNGTISPRGNSVPTYYSTTVTATDLPDPPNLASGIWRPNNTAQAYGRVTFTLMNLGNLNYTLDVPNHDGNYREYYTISSAPNGTLVPLIAYFYPNTYTASAQRVTAAAPVTSTVTDVFTPGMTFWSYENSNDPIEAGNTTQLRYYGYGHANNSYIYTMLPPQFQYEPTGTTTNFTLRKSECEASHNCPIEFTTTAGLYPFDRTTAERAAWTRVQPYDVTQITGVRWALGDWFYYWGSMTQSHFDYNLAIRARRGVADNTVVSLPTHFVYDGLGSAPPPGGTLTTTIRSHVQLLFAKVLDKSWLPTSRIRYYLTYANVGNMDETSAVVWDQIPRYTQLADTQAPAGSVILYSTNPSATLPTNPGDWSPNSSTAVTWVKWTVPGVPAGQMLSVTLTVRPQTGIPVGVEIGNTGAIVGAHSTTLTSNTVSIINAPDFSDQATTNITVDPTGGVRAGTLMRYVVKYYNTGLNAAHHVVVEDTLDPSLDDATLQFAAGSAGTYDPGTRTIRWDVGTVGTGLGGAFVYTVAVIRSGLPAGAVQNQARVKSDETPWIGTNLVANTLLTEIQGLQVEVNPRLEGQAAEYRVHFALGAAGSLAAGDALNVEFPVEMALPGTIAAGGVLLNGVPTTDACVISGQRVTVPVP